MNGHGNCLLGDKYTLRYKTEDCQESTRPMLHASVNIYIERERAVCKNMHITGDLCLHKMIYKPGPDLLAWFIK